MSWRAANSSKSRPSAPTIHEPEDMSSYSPQPRSRKASGHLEKHLQSQQPSSNNKRPLNEDSSPTQDSLPASGNRPPVSSSANDDAASTDVNEGSSSSPNKRQRSDDGSNNSSREADLHGAYPADVHNHGSSKPRSSWLSRLSMEWKRNKEVPSAEHTPPVPSTQPPESNILSSDENQSAAKPEGSSSENSTPIQDSNRPPKQEGSAPSNLEPRPPESNWLSYLTVTKRSIEHEHTQSSSAPVSTPSSPLSPPSPKQRPASFVEVQNPETSSEPTVVTSKPQEKPHTPSKTRRLPFGFFYSDSPSSPATRNAEMSFEDTSKDPNPASNTSTQDFERQPSPVEPISQTEQSANMDSTAPDGKSSTSWWTWRRPPQTPPVDKKEALQSEQKSFTDVNGASNSSAESSKSIPTGKGQDIQNTKKNESVAESHARTSRRGNSSHSQQQPTSTSNTWWWPWYSENSASTTTVSSATGKHNGPSSMVREPSPAPSKVASVSAQAVNTPDVYGHGENDEMEIKIKRPNEKPPSTPKTRSAWTSLFGSSGTSSKPKSKEMTGEQAKKEAPKKAETNDWASSSSTPSIHIPKSDSSTNTVPNTTSSSPNSFTTLDSFSKSKENNSSPKPRSRKEGKAANKPADSPSRAEASMSAAAAAAHSALESAKKKRSGKKAPGGTKLKPPNSVLPSFEDIFVSGPRSLHFAPSTSIFKKAWSLFYDAVGAESKSIAQRDPTANLPKLHSTVGVEAWPLRKIQKLVVIGVHGWFPAAWTRPIIGEPTGTSTRFADEMERALRNYFIEKGCELNAETITNIPLEGEGKIQDRVDKLYIELRKRDYWVKALREADAVFLASHSQGTLVSTMLLDKLIDENLVNPTTATLLCMASISRGPFSQHWTYQPYLYLENEATKELYHLQDQNTTVSQAFEKSLAKISEQGTKTVFVASLNDQVVPLYSGLANAYSHPGILRTTFIDGSVFSATDFPAQMVVFITSLLNANLPDHGLLNLLSTPLAGTLAGIGHSELYNEPSVYRMAVSFFFETTPTVSKRDISNRATTFAQTSLSGSSLGSSTSSGSSFSIDGRFNPREKHNSYLIPWALRGILEDESIRAHFTEELGHLRESFETWNPTLKQLQNLKAALSPLETVPRPSCSISPGSLRNVKNSNSELKKKDNADLDMDDDQKHNNNNNKKNNHATQNSDKKSPSVSSSFSTRRSKL